MKITTVHKTTIVGKCPLGCIDIYEAEFTVFGRRILMVEAIQKEIERLTVNETTQENLTYSLADVLGCHVKTKDVHSQFSSKCFADPALFEDE